MTATVTTKTNKGRRRSRAIWAAIALSVGGSLGSAMTVMITDTQAAGATQAADTSDIRAASSPLSADAAERWAEADQVVIWVVQMSADTAERRTEAAQRAFVDSCTLGPISADAAERCLFQRP